MSGHVPGGEFGPSIFHDRVVFLDEVEFRTPSRLPAKVSTNVAAAGTTSADATNLRATVNIVRSGAANSGVKLPAFDSEIVWVINAAGVSLKVYPPAGYGYDGSDANIAVTVAAGGNLMFVPDAASLQVTRVSGTMPLLSTTTARVRGVAAIAAAAA